MACFYFAKVRKYKNLILFRKKVLTIYNLGATWYIKCFLSRKFFGVMTFLSSMPCHDPEASTGQIYDE